MRKKIVAGNWKLNTNLQSGIELAKAVNESLKKIDCNCEETGIAIAPPYTHLHAINQVIDVDKICLTAQNCAAEEKGAFTGEVSVEMLKSVGVKAIIIGHSERRSIYNETDEDLLKKVNLCIKHELKPIFCFGEQLADRENDNYFNIIKSQLEGVIFKLSAEYFEKTIFAYEPVWAIGTGKTASPEQAQEMHAFVRKLIAEKYGEKIADKKTILYGGSCKPSNAKELFANPDVDGGLIGGAALKANDFIEIYKSL